MIPTLFVDTGFFLALELSRDQNHSRAQKLWARLAESPPRLVTTTYGLDEIVTFFNVVEEQDADFLHGVKVDF